MELYFYFVVFFIGVVFLIHAAIRRNERMIEILVVILPFLYIQWSSYLNSEWYIITRFGG